MLTVKASPADPSAPIHEIITVDSKRTVFPDDITCIILDDTVKSTPPSTQPVGDSASSSSATTTTTAAPVPVYFSQHEPTDSIICERVVESMDTTTSTPLVPSDQPIDFSISTTDSIIVEVPAADSEMEISTTIDPIGSDMEMEDPTSAQVVESELEAQVPGALIFDTTEVDEAIQEAATSSSETVIPLDKDINVNDGVGIELCESSLLQNPSLPTSSLTVDEPITPNIDSSISQDVDNLSIDETQNP